ncbi:hypothetical protein AB4Z48_13275 [Cupriavidus sp. 2TAF22]|uniref:hypothetical protein n=1 Tax=unclassified Cupriavidus TaxID=2640874 RepID=UPI003F8EC7A6
MNLIKALWWCPLSLLTTISVPSPDPGFEMHAAATAAQGGHGGGDQVAAAAGRARGTQGYPPGNA